MELRGQIDSEPLVVQLIGSERSLVQEEIEEPDRKGRESDPQKRLRYPEFG